MYMMKPHILDVTLRKVRMPSRHCRVFSMLMSTQRPPQQLNLKLLVYSALFSKAVAVITKWTCLLHSPKTKQK